MKNDDGEGGPAAPPGKLVEGFSLALVVLRHRKWRRNLMFGTTLLTLFLVFGGVVILGDRLMDRPIAFLIFWGICFVLVGLVLILAVLDVMIIRREHRGKMRELERRLANAADEVHQQLADESESEPETETEAEKNAAGEAEGGGTDAAPGVRSGPD